MIKYAPTTTAQRPTAHRDRTEGATRTTAKSEGITIISVQDTFGCKPMALPYVGFTRPGPHVIGSLAFMFLAWLGGGFVVLPFAAYMCLNDASYIRNKGRKKPGKPREICHYGEGQWQLPALEAIVGTGVTNRLASAGEEAAETDSEPEALTVKAETVPSTPAPAIVTPPPSTPAPAPAPVDPATLTTPLIEREPVAQITEPSPFAPTPTVSEPTEDERSELLKAHKKTKLTSSPQGILSELFLKEDGYFSSWFVMGVPRTGKGVCLAYSLVLAQVVMQGVEVYAIDAKADPAEFSRWGFLKASQRYHFKGSRSQWTREERTKIKAGVFRILRMHENSTAPYKLLVIDELPAILRVLGPKDGRALMDYCNSVASQGPSTGSITWIFSNSITLQGNGVRAADMAFYMLMYLATPKKLSAITTYKNFTGPKIKPDDPVFEVTGRAGWASTLPEWVAIPNTYNELVEGLTKCNPPANFGSGDFENSQGAIALNKLAGALADQLVALGVPSLEFTELVKGTSFGGMYAGADDSQALAITRQLVDGLKNHDDVITINYLNSIYTVSLPRYKEEEATYQDEDEDTAGSLWDTSWLA